nr:hypothetical protein [Tanacetum cinerariifolium]
MFTMRIHYVRRFTKLPRRKYVEGEIMDVYVEHDKSVVDPSLNVDEGGPSNVLGHENDEGQNKVGTDEGNYDEAENKDIGDGKDYEAKNEEGRAEDEVQNEKVDKAEDLGEREEEDKGDEEDKHINDIVEEEHIVDELEVEMDVFKFAAKGENEDPMQPKLNMNETNLEVLDFDSFESDIDDDKEGFKRKGDYVQELKRCNPNTTVKIDVYGEENPNSPTRMFKRIFVCLGALKDGFRAFGRELLGFDGAFVRGQKVLLPAIAKLFLRLSIDMVDCGNHWDYVQELKRCNPNTTVKIDVYGEENPNSPTRMFKRIFVCLGALKDGFRAFGRELLGFDGAFVRGVIIKLLMDMVLNLPR